MLDAPVPKQEHSATAPAPASATAVDDTEAAPASAAEVQHTDSASASEFAIPTGGTSAEKDAENTETAASLPDNWHAAHAPEPNQSSALSLDPAKHDPQQDTRDAEGKVGQDQADCLSTSLDESERPLCEAWVELLGHLIQLSFGTTRPEEPFVPAKSVASEMPDGADPVDSLTKTSHQSEECSKPAAVSAHAETAPHALDSQLVARTTAVKIPPTALTSARAVMNGARRAAQSMLRDYTELLDDLSALLKLSSGQEAAGADERVQQALRRHCEGEREALLRSLRAIHEAAAVLTRDSWWGEAEKGTSELNATLAKHASSW